MALLAIAPVRESRADAATQDNAQEIQLQEYSETIHLALHPEIITILYLPTKALSALISNQERFAVEIKNERIVIRPAANLGPDVVANLHVATKDIKLNVFITIAPTPEAATAQLVVRLPPPSPPRPSLFSRSSLSIGAILGYTFPELPHTATKLGRSPLMGIEAHLVLNDASRNHELVMTIAHTTLDYLMPPREDMLGPGQPLDDPLALRWFTHVFLLMRLDAGATWRLGTGSIPFVYLRSGLQARIPLSTLKNIGMPNQPAVVPDEGVPGALDMFLIMGTGTDMAILQKWRAGMQVSVTRTIVSTGGHFLSLEGSLFMRWY